MITFYNHAHTLHQGKMEMFRGQMVPCFEVPARADHVLSEIVARRLGTVASPQPFDPAVLAGIHDPAYLQFLEHAWDDWVAMDPFSQAEHVSACRTHREVRSGPGQLRMTGSPPRFARVSTQLRSGLHPSVPVQDTQVVARGADRNVAPPSQNPHWRRPITDQRIEQSPPHRMVEGNHPVNQRRSRLGRLCCRVAVSRRLP